MDYEKKYKEALERAKIWREKSGMPNDRKGILDDIFPELIENEDERIRKALIKFLKDGVNGHPYTWIYSIDVNDIISWLEKQGEKKSEWSEEDEYIIQALVNCVDELKENCGWNYAYTNSGKNIPVDVLKSWLEKHSEQKPWDFVKPITEEDKLHLMPEDKVEPKFKVGDWVYHESSGNTFHINKIENRTYISDEGATISFGRQNDWRLWTIQDAKDGDVLYSIDSKQPFIYKERPQFSQARGYCCINKFGEFAIWNTSKCVICTDKYIPATKEQRDLLFQKMKEAGYEWDAEKKELKKIEPKSAWSEEDEKIALSIEQVMNCASLLNIVPEKIDKIRTWLKSLKDRCTWKPSKAQIEAIEDAIEFLGCTKKVREDLKSLHEQLKKLRE